MDVYCVDNALARPGDPEFVGAMDEAGAALGARAVRRAHAGERVGVFAAAGGRGGLEVGVRRIIALGCCIHCMSVHVLLVHVLLVHVLLVHVLLVPLVMCLPDCSRSCSCSGPRMLQSCSSVPSCPG